jgi:hypothetical protein
MDLERDQAHFERGGKGLKNMKVSNKQSQVKLSNWPMN